MSVLKPLSAKTSSAAKKLADTWFSRFIRLRDADWQGNGRCITSGMSVYWKNGDCGHFMTRQHLRTRWEERNCALQSKRDNGPLGGRQYEFGRAIDRKYGAGSADKLSTMSRMTVKFSRLDMLEIAEKYRTKALEEANKRGITL